MEAKRNAENLGMAMGLAIVAAEALREKKQAEQEECNQEHQLMQ